MIRDEKEPVRTRPHQTLRRGVRPEVLIWAKQLRANPAAGEAALWSRLRASRMGFRFRRQATLRGWIADFWCPAKRLVVEVDGWSHRNEARRIKDWVRDRRLSEEFGIKTLRFPVEAMVDNLDKVVDQVKATLASRPTAYIHCTGTNSHTRRRGVLPLIHDSMEKLETMTPEEALRSSLELDRERTDIRSIEEYVLMIRQLVDIKNVLGDAPAGTRVRTSIRDLQECLPQIRQMDDHKVEVSDKRPDCRTGAAPAALPGWAFDGRPARTEREFLPGMQFLSLVPKYEAADP